MAFLLRVALPDRPGSLGQLASALGAVGADIEAIEVVERRLDGCAIDDVLVGLPGGGLPDSLVSACESVPGVTVEWFSRFAAGGGLFPDLEAVEVMTHEPLAAAARLADVLPTVFRADWAALLTVPGPSGLLAVEHATPAAPELSGLPFPASGRSGARRVAVPETWTGPVGADLVLAVASVTTGWGCPPPDGSGGSAASDGAPCGVAPAGMSPAGAVDPHTRMLAIGRRGGPEFLDSELARLFHLASLAASITASAGSAVGAAG